MEFTPTKLDAMSRREMQSICKANGIRANSKNTVMRAALHKHLTKGMSQGGLSDVTNTIPSMQRLESISAKKAPRPVLDEVVEEEQQEQQKVAVEEAPVCEEEEVAFTDASLAEASTAEVEPVVAVEDVHFEEAPTQTDAEDMEMSEAPAVVTTTPCKVQAREEEEEVVTTPMAAEKEPLLMARPPITPGIFAPQERWVVATKPAAVAAQMPVTPMVPPGLHIEEQQEEIEQPQDLKVEEEISMMEQEEEQVDAVVVEPCVQSTEAECVQDVAVVEAAAPAQVAESDNCISSLIDGIAELSFNDHGKVHCALTGHDMKAAVPAVMRHLNCAKFNRAKADMDLDISVYAPWIKDSPCGSADKVICTLTKAELPRKKSSIERHLAGQTFRSMKEASRQQKLKMKGIPTPKGKKTHFNTPNKAISSEYNVHWEIGDYDDKE